MADISTDIAQWSGTAGSNSPSGSTSVSTGLDDNLRAIQAALVLAFSAKGSDIASAATVDLSATNGLFHDITGTTTITSFGTVRAGIWKVLKFEGALTLTHNATSLILPGAANITTVDGDIGIFVSEGSGNWRCVVYAGKNINASAGTFSGAVSLTGGDLTVSRSSSGGNVQTILANTSNTASSNAILDISTAGSSAADPYLSIRIAATQNWAMGIDNSDSDKFKIAGSGSLGTSDYLAIGASGLVEFPQSMFFKRKTADESVTSSTTLQDDNHLTFSIAANEEWIARITLDAGAALGTTGIKVAVTTPAGATQSIVADVCTDVQGQNFTLRTATSGTELAFAAANLAGAANGRIEVVVWVLNGGTAGSTTLQFAQNTSSGTAVTLRRGSSMVAHRVA